MNSSRDVYIVVNMISDRLRGKISSLFSEYESELLLNSLDNGDLDVELGLILDLVEARIYPKVKAMIDDIFCSERLRIGVEPDIGDKVQAILEKAAKSIDKNNMRLYMERQKEIRRVESTLKGLKEVLKGMPKETGRGRKGKVYIRKYKWSRIFTPPST